MPKIRLGINKNSKNGQGKSAVQIMISSNSKTTTIGLSVYVNSENWDDVNKTVLPDEPRFKQKNSMIEARFEEYNNKYEDLYKKGKLPNDVYKIRDILTAKENDVTFLDYLISIRDGLSGNYRITYNNTITLINRFINKRIYFEDITPEWLTKLEKFYLKDGGINGLAVNMRNIRKVYNHAINNKVVPIEYYPFRAYKIKSIETEHRTLTVRELRRLRTYSGSDIENWARDIFMLSFYLIGINMIDLFEYGELNTRVVYHRSKTKKLYDIKIQPEAREIIENLGDYKRNIQTADAFKKKVNKNLQIIATKIGVRELTTYYARHTWSTFASEIDVPKETISKSLGHGNRTVTDTYIDYNYKKVDKANRRVIDYSLKIKRVVKPFIKKARSSQTRLHQQNL